METNTQQLWIYLDEGDSRDGRSLAMQIIDTLRASGCPGATVLRGIGGYGVHGVVHTDLIADLPGHLPLVICCIDRADRIQRVLPQLEVLVREGMIAVTPVQVIKSSRREGGPFPRHLTVADVMTRDVTQVAPDAPVAEIVQLLIEHALKALPVVDTEGHVVGIITDGDLLRRGATTLSIRLQRELPDDMRAQQAELLTHQPQHAADLMTAAPITAAASASLGEAAAVMAEQNLKRLPVVDGQNRLIGMVSRYDLLNTIAEGLRQHPETTPHLPAGAPETVGALMTGDVPTVTPDTPLADTLERLLETPKRRVVVLDDEARVIGIITDGDVMRRAARKLQGGALQRIGAWLTGGKRPAELELETRGRTAADVMSSPVITATPETPTVEAIRLMIRHRIKRLPVIDERHRLLGLVGRAAVLAALSRGGRSLDGA